MVLETRSPKILRFATFEVDVRAGELRKQGKRVKLQNQPFQVLVILLQRPGDVVTREELRSQIWQQDTFVDFDKSLNAAVNRLREALGDSADNPRFVETLPRRGYRFIVPVEYPRLTTGAAPAAEPELIPRRDSIDPVAASSSPATIKKRNIRALVMFSTVAVMAIAALLLQYRRSAIHQPMPAVRSVAVLPLKNLSGDPTQEYFSDGMTESIIARLSTIRGLRVISRTSVMRFKDTKLAVSEIAQTLQVDAIVEGSVIREGDRIRVRAQLIRAASDDHFWSETYDRELRDVLALQSEVAQSIAEKVEASVTREEHSRLVASRPVAPEVYESFLKGAFTGDYSRAGMERSIAYFEDAIRRDPSFAPAYVGLANTYFEYGTPGIGGAAPNRVRPKVISAIRKALELDPEHPAAHALLAGIYQEQWRWNDAEFEYRRALKLNPNDSSAHLGFAGWLLCQGRTEEAQQWARRARELDPFGVRGNAMGWMLFQSRRFDEAIRELRSDLAVHSDDASSYWFLGFALIANDQAGQAIGELEKALVLSKRSPGVIGVLVRAYAHAGQRTKALHLLDELERRQKDGYVPAAAFVNAYLGLDDNEQALVWLQRAYDEHSMILQFAKVHPFLDPLRSDPRFQSLLHRVGLEEAR